MVNYVVTGSNKGIGLGLVKEISKDPNARVFATVRDPTKSIELNEFAKEHPNVEVIKLSDISSVESTQEAVKSVESKLGKDEGIDIIFSNAGVSYSYDKTIDTKPEVYLDHWKINALGNLITVQQFFKLLQKSNTRQIFFTSSIGGSIAGYIPNAIAPYGSSKAALNHLIRDLNVDLKAEGYSFIAVHPGLVTTELGNIAVENLLGGDFESAKKLYGLITPEESAEGIVKNIIKGFSGGKIDIDHLWGYDGTQHQW